MEHRHFLRWLPLLGLGLGLVSNPLLAAPEAFEVGPRQTDVLPGGKEADGIIGDFILRNDRIEAVIAHKAPQRRANMSTYYGDDGITPGCLYDLTLRGTDNDQLTIFGPLNQRGDVSFVRVARDGSEGTAVVETEISPAINAGIYEHHAYHLQDGWQGLLVVSTVRNETNQAHVFKTADSWKSFSETGTFQDIKSFSETGTFQDITWGDSVNPADKAGYAYAWTTEENGVIPQDEVSLKPGESIRLARFLAVAHSPAEALGLVADRIGEPGRLVRKVIDSQGNPLSTPTLNIVYSEGEKTKRLPAYPDDQGLIDIFLPAGIPLKLEWRDHGRNTLTSESTLEAGQTDDARVGLSAAAKVAFSITDEAGRSLPCKVQFRGLGDTPSPNLGPNIRAHGCADQYHSETGTFSVPLDPGRYQIIVTRGIEYSHLDREIDLKPGNLVEVSGVLRRMVQTPGWISADFHNHSTPSGDNTCGTDDRVINLAAEHIEFAPTTEHNRLYDWRPHIESLGLTDYIQTVPGIELTGSGAHLNSFPFEPQPFRQDGGAPVWQKDPRLNAIILRDFQGQNPDRWVQINHPDMTENFIDRDADGRVDGGYLTLGKLIDGLETQNYRTSEILSGAPYKIVKEPKTLARQIAYVREFIWLQLLNQGHRVWGVSVADAHTVYGNGVGSWRNYLPSSTDDPKKIDWKEIAQHAKAGRMILSSGPYLSVETSDGTIAGGTTRITDALDLKVKVQCTDWIEIDRVQLLINGVPRPEFNFTRASHPDMFADDVVVFDQTWNVPLSQDSHLIVVAVGENATLEKGFGTSDQAPIRPCAYNNPIFVDVDGGGFTANGDTLGHPLPVKNLTIGQVQAALEN